MNAAIPITATLLGGLSLSLAVYFTWQALRAALRIGSVAETLSFQDDDRRHDLLDRKAAILEDIRDLDLEHRAGKLSDSDFQASEATLRSEAREILRALDESIAPYRAEAEALVMRRLGRSSLSSPATGEADEASDEAKAKALISSDPAVEGALLPDRVCPSCTVGNPSDAENCAKCGTRLTPIECASCQTVNDADATFCKKCGSSLEASEDSE